MNYWNKYYTKPRITKPSNFAKFCLKYLKSYITILDLGCGNGRDSIFFQKKGFFVIGVDKANIINPGFLFKKQDFTKLPNFAIDNIYMRFSLHSVNKIDETKILKWVYRNLLKGVFCIEVRSINDELYGKGRRVDKDEYVYGHYRRFIRKENLEKSLKQLGFKIIYSKEARDFAPLEKENPSIIRIIAKK